MLKERIEAAGLTQKELARISGVSLRTIEHWVEHGVENGAVKNVVKVADALQLFIEQLMTDEYDEYLMEDQ